MMAHDLQVNQVLDPDLGGEDEAMAPTLPIRRMYS